MSTANAMKILLVHNFYQRPGGEDVVFELERQLLERAGHSVITYCRSNWEVNAYQGLGKLVLIRHTIWAKDTRAEIARLLSREKPDLVHVHNTFAMVSPSIFSVCQEAGIPVVMTLHNYRLYCPAATFFRNGHTCEDCVDHGLWRGIYHSCYRESRAETATVALTLAVHRGRETWIREVDTYIALSQFARSRFLRGGLPPEKVMVKPNFVHPDPGIRDDTTGDYVLFVGRLSPEKRVNTMLTAWSRLCKEIPLVIIGGGPQRIELEQEKARSGLTKVTFLGQLPRREALEAMRRARFLIFSSEWYENFPMTIAESFANGVPVISSRLGAMQEIIEDGRTGLFFEAGNPRDLAEKVEKAWNDPQLMRLMGKEARQEFEQKYTAEKNYPLLMGIYEHVLRGRRPLGARVAPPAVQSLPGPYGRMGGS